MIRVLLLSRSPLVFLAVWSMSLPTSLALPWIPSAALRAPFLLARLFFSAGDELNALWYFDLSEAFGSNCPFFGIVLVGCRLF